MGKHTRDAYTRFDGGSTNDDAQHAGVPADVIELARAGKLLDAIKRYRELTGAGLAEARDVVKSI